MTPGGTRTPIWSRIAPTEDARGELERRLAQYVPLGRLGEAEDVAQAVLFLASDETRNMSGTEIVLDGGATGAPYGAAVFTPR